MTDYLCPEWQRLWDEWKETKNELENNIDEPQEYKLSVMANALWINFLDHRATCRICAPLTRRKKSGII
jgi:hypothetical protein